MTSTSPRPASPVRVSGEVERWLRSDGNKTVGGLIAVFEEKSFALLFVLLLGVPALPLPTGGVTHVFELIAIVLALQLVAGRKTIWLPRRWCRLELAGPKRERFLTGLLRLIRRLEGVSHPRLVFLFGHRASNAVVGLLVTGLSAAAFLAPPFTGLDTLPALGAVVLSLGVLLEDGVVAAAGLFVGLAGIAVELVLGNAAVRGIESLL
jgi:hypothetical protein